MQTKKGETIGDFEDILELKKVLMKQQLFCLIWSMQLDLRLEA